MTVVRYRFGSSCGDGPDETDDSRTGQRRFYRRLPRLSDARPRPPTVRRVSFSRLYFHPTTVRNGKHESHTTTLTCVVCCFANAYRERPTFGPGRGVYEAPPPAAGNPSFPPPARIVVERKKTGRRSPAAADDR